MKARYLKSILGTNRPITDDGEKVCVGSYMVHDLLSVDKKTLKLRYALGYPSKDRDSIDDDELRGLWDKLQAVIDSGEIKSIIEENDVLENPIPVFTYNRDFAIVESMTDAIGYPNVTHDGKLMYDNTYFPSETEARCAAVKDAVGWRETYLEQIEELTQKLAQKKERLEVVEKAIQDHGAILSQWMKNETTRIV